MMVILVGLQVLVEVVDAFCQQSDLHFGGTGVAFMLGIGGNDLLCRKRENRIFPLMFPRMAP